jgi:D-galactarolactone cycloisomerase
MILSASQNAVGPIRIADVRTLVFRAPIATPVRTSFGMMQDRPCVLVRIEDQDGAVGWGEVWCNFPTCGAEHRAKLVQSVLAPMLVGHSFGDPAAVFRMLSQKTHVLALQSGEPGPLAQGIAGVDIALWDLVARRANRPLWRLLGATRTSVAVYASGLNPDAPERLAAEKRAEGFTAFKAKVGFGRDLDIHNLRALRSELGGGTTLMIDANQCWDPVEAGSMAALLASYDLLWLEEPIAVDYPAETWANLAKRSPIKLAGGENVRGRPQFDQLIKSAALSYVQPDIGKWGGFSGCIGVGLAALEADLVFCPHWLGGGIGLVASMHLLAAVGGSGMVEIDANPNPLRQLVAVPHPTVANGHVELPTGPGLGVAPDLEACREFEVRL